MLAVRSLLRSNAQFAKNVVQKRNMTVVVVPPREKVTTAEITILAATMVICWCAIPAWVLRSIKKYRHLEE